MGASDKTLAVVLFVFGLADRRCHFGRDVISLVHNRSRRMLGQLRSQPSLAVLQHVGHGLRTAVLDGAFRSAEALSLSSSNQASLERR